MVRYLSNFGRQRRVRNSSNVGSAKISRAWAITHNVTFAGADSADRAALIRTLVSRTNASPFIGKQSRELVLGQTPFSCFARGFAESAREPVGVNVSHGSIVLSRHPYAPHTIPTGPP